MIEARKMAEQIYEHCRYCDWKNQDERLKCRGDAEDCLKAIELLCELALAEDALAREALPDHVDKYLLQAEMSKRIGKALDAIRAAGLIPDELGTKQDPPWRGPKGEQHEKA